MIILSNQQIEHYQRWEKTSLHNLAGRYTFGFEGVSIFAIENSDVLTVIAAYKIESTYDGSLIQFDETLKNNVIQLKAISHKVAHEIVSLIDGIRCFGDICKMLESTIERDMIVAVCQACFGVIIANERPIKALQHRIRKEEIVRFPVQSAYMMLRSYWCNCADVRESIGGLIDELQSIKQLMIKVADIHIISTMGKNLNCFYGGSGGVATIPGGYRIHPMSTGMSEAKSIFIDEYLQELGLKRMIRTERLVFTESNTLIGMVSNNAMTFRHPPPDDNLLVQIFDEIRLVLVDVSVALNGSHQADMIKALSRIHKLFLHAHPFYNINNSIIMNFINDCLSKIGLGVMPHLLLDFIALRIDFNDYHIVFKYAVENYALRRETGENIDVTMSKIMCYFEKLSLIEKLVSERQ